MQIRTHNLFAENFKAIPGIRFAPASLEVHREVQVLMARELDQEVQENCNSGYSVVGWAEFVGKNDLGVGAEAREQAGRVGATMVLFKLWPAKLRAVRYLPDGSIDLASVLADPPANLSPKGYSVVKAAFLGPNPSFNGTPLAAPVNSNVGHHEDGVHNSRAVGSLALSVSRGSGRN